MFIGELLSARPSLSSSGRASYSPPPRLDNTTAYEAPLSDSAFEEYVWGLIGPPMGAVERDRWLDPTPYITGLMKTPKEGEFSFPSVISECVADEER